MDFLNAALPNFVGGLLAIFISATVYGLLKRRYKEFWTREHFRHLAWQRTMGKYFIIRLFYKITYPIEKAIIYIFFPDFKYSIRK